MNAECRARNENGVGEAGEGVAGKQRSVGGWRRSKIPEAETLGASLDHAKPRVGDLRLSC